MRILFDSKLPQHKRPFGCLTPGEECTLSVHIPVAVMTRKAEMVLCGEDGGELCSEELHFEKTVGPYEYWTGSFRLEKTGLYFYYFRITDPHGTFRLFKEGDDTNMEAGDLWQVSCIPSDFYTPRWAQGAVIYQVFPDRFARSGWCDCTGKLQPYSVHDSWYDEVDWRPDEHGIIQNNDFFGGNFRGIGDKMDYIASLGTTILYLNPISKSFSSHRYDTGDYKTPDPMLGTEADFAALCRCAHAHGIRVILDGVYSHTGSNSLYFDRNYTFGGNGAYCRPDSPFHSWYTFYHWPDRYNSWWGFDTLPTVNKMDGHFLDYIIRDEDSVVAHWLKLGADGFRLDVADELPDAFIALLRERIREIKPDALLLGEVWEDASNKVAYNIRRKYFTEGELDSVMNYPFRTAILDFMRGRDAGKKLRDTVMTVVENYPAQVVACNMNLLGSHDTPRILTALVDDFDGSREEKAARHLSKNQLEVARDRLQMAAFLQYTLPGSPSLYYGDEALMEGYKDPFNRRTYPWGREDTELVRFFRQLGQLRRDIPALGKGTITFQTAMDKHLAYTRCYEGQKFTVYVNRSGDPWQVPAGKVRMGKNLDTVARDQLILSPHGFCIVEA